MAKKNLGIDLGTANTLVFLKGKGVVVNEPSVVAVNTLNREVLAVGDSAKQMIGRTPGSIVAIRPMKDGVIADFDTTQAMLKYFISKALRQSLFRPRYNVVVCVPSGVTEVEKRAVIDATISAGAKEKDSFLILEPMAAAIGANLPVNDPVGSMIVDIGGGTSEVAVISLSGIVTSKSLRIAGDAIDISIVNFIKKTYNLAIGERTAESIKIQIGFAYEADETISIEIRGRDLLTGLPKNVLITAEEIEDAINDPVFAIIEAIKYTLEKTPPELSSDIITSGITLAGGGALLRGLDKLITKETGVPVHIAVDPLDCVANGTGHVVEHLDIYRGVLITNKTLNM